MSKADHLTDKSLAQHKASLEKQIAGLRAEYDRLGDFRMEELADAEKSLKKLEFLLRIRKWRSNSDAVSREELIAALADIEKTAESDLYGDEDGY